LTAYKSATPSQALIEALPTIPHDTEGPIFAEPWQAEAFAMALALHERGLFTWPEWAATLSGEIRAAQNAGDADLGDTYYCHWLAALERLIVAKGVTDLSALQDCAEAWDRAAQATPHGQPIHLHNDPHQDDPHHRDHA
jgi:nitrile hydratase accessory protein